MGTFFSDVFAVEAEVIDDFGAFNVSLVADLPLFIDPFLLFGSEREEYRELHDSIIRYLVFLKDRSLKGPVADALLRAWYCFPEFKQTWLGFSALGNEGHGLGIDFARALHGSLNDLFSDFGAERVTQGSHLEKVCLIKDGVGRDNISDFTTNLIKRYLLDFTQRFAQIHLRPDQRKRVAVPNVVFDYELGRWMPMSFELPWAGGDFVVLTPKDMLTKDDTWINRHDLVDSFARIPSALPDEQLRAQVSDYFFRRLIREDNRDPSKKDREAAATATILRFPTLIDYYIREKEERAEEAGSVSSEKVRFSQIIYNERVLALQAQLSTNTTFYHLGSTYDETHARVEYLKHVIEDQGGHRLFYKDGKPFQYEKDLQIMFRLVWFGTPSDVSSEVNDGRGPADFKISRGSGDKTIVEMKLAKNNALKRNLEKQAEIYQRASGAKSAIKVIVYFTEAEHGRVVRILSELDMLDCRDVVLIDARMDNKPSASKAA